MSKPTFQPITIEELTNVMEASTPDARKLVFREEQSEFQNYAVAIMALAETPARHIAGTMNLLTQMYTMLRRQVEATRQTQEALTNDNASVGLWVAIAVMVSVAIVFFWAGFVIGGKC
jgi:hypothetical protein